jgi:anhydro-N-acetylmuramic acid kinase
MCRERLLAARHIERNPEIGQKSSIAAKLCEVQIPVFRAIGLMSGTSMDGVDAALIQTNGEDAVSLGPSAFFPYQDADRALLRKAIADAALLAQRHARPGALGEAEAMITERHAEAVEAFLAAESIERTGVDLIGFHGQTVLHRPERRLTVQIGRGADLAQRLRMTVAFDFRAADVAAGGQGAPLMPIFHRALAAAANFSGPVIFINIGGVANLTFVAPGEELIACDTGPGNALIDDLLLNRLGLPFDRDGATAAAGKVNRQILDELLANPYFAVPPPKSLDRNDFSSAPAERLDTADAAATLTAFTAAAIARALAHLPAAPLRAIVCGGGARNKTLMRELALRLPCPVFAAEVFGWHADALEAQGFAYLAVRRARDLPITFPMTTGVREPLPGGVLAWPRARTR